MHILLPETTLHMRFQQPLTKATDKWECGRLGHEGTKQHNLKPSYDCLAELEENLELTKGFEPPTL